MRPTFGRAGSTTSAKGRASEEALHRQLEENRKLQTALREEANRDPMTGLFNRRYLEPTFDRELARCIREKRPIALLLMDVDHFKQVNDTYGHPAGDEVLKSLSDRLTAGSRAEDIPCRLGGEEFLVVMPKMPLATALERAEAWRTTFASEPIQTGAGPISATISLGVASFPSMARRPPSCSRRPTRRSIVPSWRAGTGWSWRSRWATDRRGRSAPDLLGVAAVAAADVDDLADAAEVDELVVVAVEAAGPVVRVAEVGLDRRRVGAGAPGVAEVPEDEP